MHFIARYYMIKKKNGNFLGRGLKFLSKMGHDVYN